MSLENIIARRNTREFIRTDKITVQLVRSTKVSTGTGGYRKGPPTTLPAQDFRLVPTSTRAGDQTYRTPDGKFAQVRQELIGMPDADMQALDTFTHNGLEYEIVHVSPEVTDRKSGWVVQRGDGSG